MEAAAFYQRHTYFDSPVGPLAAVLTEGLLPSRIPFTGSWPFVTILTLFLIVWGARLFRSFSLMGAGLWLALLAGMLGSADAYKPR